MLHKIKRTYQKFVIGVMRSKQRRAAYETAQWLTSTNRDFAHWSVEELAEKILKK